MAGRNLRLQNAGLRLRGHEWDGSWPEVEIRSGCPARARVSLGYPVLMWLISFFRRDFADTVGELGDGRLRHPTTRPS